MAFFKFRWPGQSEQAQADKPAKRSRNTPQAESIEAMRRRARHRLIGAAVLVLVGVVGFPLLFDTQPRPIAVDIPIEIPDRNKTAPVVVPAAAVPQASAPAPAAVARQTTPASPAPAASQSGSRTASGQSGAGHGLSDGEEIVSSARPALVPKPPVVAVAPKPEPAPKPEHKPEPKPEPKPVATPAPEPKPARTNDEAARARALLEGRTAPAAAATASASAEDGRFIVQVGAFADADKAREARTKVERAGLKTYMQVVDTKDGKRTRVRVGPFNNRADADKAAGKIRSLELSASVLTI